MTSSNVLYGAKTKAELTFEARHGAICLLSKLAHLVRHVDAEASFVMLAQTDLTPRWLLLITSEFKHVTYFIEHNNSKKNT